MKKYTFRKIGFALFVIYAVTGVTSAAQTLTTLASFDQFDGSAPYFGPLVQGTDGNLYGTTAFGGANCSPSGCGTVFKVSPDGTLTSLYSFCAQLNCTDGKSPYVGLVQANDGNFYGTTTDGGVNGHGGTIFRITLAGKLTTLYSFCSQTNCTDGSYPSGTLVQAADGNFYGTTFLGGIGDAQYCNGGCGTVFKITRKGALTTLHSFAGYNTEGSAPKAGLVQSSNGNFYGTTTGGGAYNSCSLGCGTIFKITLTGTLTTLHSFAGSPTDGSAPYASLALGNSEILYGTTYQGGTYASGTVFKITSAGTFTTVYNFCAQANCVDGQTPQAGLVLASDGNVYGATIGGGAYTAGSIFKVTPAGALSTIYSFCSQGFPTCPDGSLVYTGLTQATNGELYGSTSEGGNLACEFGYGCGTVFSLDLGLGPLVTFIHNPARVGQMFGILGQGLTGTTGVSLNGTLCNFAVRSDAFVVATVPTGATSGYVNVTTPGGVLASAVPFRVIP